MTGPLTGQQTSSGTARQRPAATNLRPEARLTRGLSKSDGSVVCNPPLFGDCCPGFAPFLSCAMTISSSSIVEALLGAAAFIMSRVRCPSRSEGEQTSSTIVLRLTEYFEGAGWL